MSHGVDHQHPTVPFVAAPTRRNGCAHSAKEDDLRVYLIRHAESEENILDLRRRTSTSDYNAILRRSPEVALTPLGLQQAEAVAVALADRQIERLYTSPYVRAQSTAAMLAATLGLTPLLIEELHEVLPQANDRIRRPASLRRHFVRDYVRMLWPLGGGETWLAAYRRSRVAWGRITAEPATSIAAVSHRGLIGLILLSLRRSSRWRVLQNDLTNGGISVVEARYSKMQKD